MYFGDDHIGLFRKFPGQYRQTCGRYDPRVRPWYVNSLSPPRDVIILVDLSGSMRAGSAITHAINSAQYIIERLNVADSFAVVAFGTRVQQIYPEGGGMVKGNLENTANAAGAVHRPVCRGMRVHLLMRRCHQVRSPTSRRRARR